jgi:hypothetical protein
VVVGASTFFCNDHEGPHCGPGTPTSRAYGLAANPDRSARTGPLRRRLYSAGHLEPRWERGAPLPRLLAGRHHSPEGVADDGERVG